MSGLTKQVPLTLESKIKNLFKLAAKAAVTIILLTWVFSNINFQQFADACRQARWQILILTWAVTAISLWLQSFKMWFILKKLDCKINLNTVVGSSAVTALYGLVLPGMLDSSVKWYVLQKSTGKPSNVFSSMVYNQFTTMVFIIVLGLAAIIVNNPSDNPRLPAICLALLLAIIAVCLLLVNQKSGPKLTKCFLYILKPLPEKIYLKFKKILNQLMVFQTAGWKFHLAILATSLVNTLTAIIIYITSAKAAGINVPASAIIWQLALVYILGRLPISLANLGVREVALVESLAIYGVAAPAALLMSMIIFSAIIVVALIGAGYQLLWLLKKNN